MRSYKLAYSGHRNSYHLAISGFTLMELLVVITIVAILAATAIPSYRRYAITNAEGEAKAKMLQLKMQLESWRSSRLSYKGFIPTRGDGICPTGNHCYDNKNTIIYVPEGSNASNYKYAITLADGNNTSSSLVVAPGLNNAIGRSWTMFATPRSGGPVESGHKIKMTSTGVQCITKDANISIADKDCGTSSSSEVW